MILLILLYHLITPVIKLYLGKISKLIQIEIIVSIYYLV